jgi:preprotein translocase subunit SecD
MQLRPVLNAHGGACAHNGANPSATETVTLPEAQSGRCFDLGPAQFTVFHADAVPEASASPTAGVHLRVTLNATDAAAFDRMAAVNYEKQIAIVMFGEVLTAPTVLAKQYSGTLIIGGPNGGLDPQTAANIKAALGG